MQSSETAEHTQDHESASRLCSAKSWLRFETTAALKLNLSDFKLCFPFSLLSQFWHKHQTDAGARLCHSQHQRTYESELQASLRRAARCSHYSQKKLSRRLKQTSLS